MVIDDYSLKEIITIDYQIFLIYASIYTTGKLVFNSFGYIINFLSLVCFLIIKSKI